MPKPKQFLKEKKPSKRAPTVPQDADEYLAAGVDFEEAGEKWRGGDAAKSTRFFIRAIDMYEDGLKKFPNSFDLAYNKARVQYELTQHPKLRGQLPGSLLELLQVALESSRVALNLNNKNPDVLFNTGQCLTSLCEAVQESRSSTERKDDVLPLLQEAIELFEQCLFLQEYQYDRMKEQQTMVEATSQIMTDTPIEESEYQSAGEAEQTQQWATLEEPITPNVLLDTILAQLETLTLLCGLLTGAEFSHSLDYIDRYASDLLLKRLPAHLENAPQDRIAEATLTKANFTAALHDLKFRLGQIDYSAYATALDEAYSDMDATDAEALCDRADALLTFASSVRAYSASPPSETAAARWKALTGALGSLGAATKQPDADNLARIHVARGDAEVLRWQLGLPGIGYAAARANAGALLKNAGVYYRGAEGLAGAAGVGMEKVGVEARVKRAVVAAYAGELGEFRGVVERVRREGEEGLAGTVLREALEEEIVGAEWLAEFEAGIERGSGGAFEVGMVRGI